MAAIHDEVGSLDEAEKIVNDVWQEREDSLTEDYLGTRAFSFLACVAQERKDRILIARSSSDALL